MLNAGRFLRSTDTGMRIEKPRRRRRCEAACRAALSAAVVVSAAVADVAADDDGDLYLSDWLPDEPRLLQKPGNT